MGGEHEAGSRRPQLTVSPEGWAEPHRAIVLHVFGDSFKQLRSYAKLGSQAQRFLHARVSIILYSRAGVANYGVRAKWSNVLFCKKGFTGTPPYPFTCILSVVVPGLQWQSCVVVTETRWPRKPKILTICPLQKRVAFQ